MKSKLHFLITGERGETKSFVISKLRIRSSLFLFIGMGIVLSSLSLAGVFFWQRNKTLEHTVVKLQDDLQTTITSNQDFQNEMEELQRQAHRQDQEKEAQFSDALQGLQQRSQAIESILNVVGVDVETRDDDAANSGGPFADLSGRTYEDLTAKVDFYLSLIKPIPMGTPVPGTVVSQYGRRIDPINNQPAFHDGVDIRNASGTEVVATADGTVSEWGFTSSKGYHLELDHGQGFKTAFLHLKKGFVKKGQKVTRGQTIGLLGNTGRSTGPHLHYSVLYQGKTVNPVKFMQLAKYVRGSKDTK